MVTSVPKVRIGHDDVYRGCVFGKFVKATFPRSDTRSEGILDLVHLDICKPMLTTSLWGYKYFVTFINDFSKKT